MKRRYQVDLPAEMAQCALNYARLQRLLPTRGYTTHERVRDCSRPQGRDCPRQRGLNWESRQLGVGDDLCISIDITERGPYTTTLHISQNAVSEAVPSPRLTVRVYHDARLAEVVAFSNRRRVWPRYDYPNSDMHQPDEKAQWNRFLGDWLSLCLHQGWTREQALPVA